MRIGVVIPTYNEQDHIGATLQSFARQVDGAGDALPRGTVEVVVVDTPGDDRTADVAREVGAACPNLAVTVLTDPTPSMVAARITGMNHLLARGDAAPARLVSADADTTFPPTWLWRMTRLMDTGPRMVAAAGAFDDELWAACPTLTRRYAASVGTIFFDERTTRSLPPEERTGPFGPELFARFGRPVADCGFAVETGLYAALGGFRQEFYDDAGRRPILAAGWPLMFRAHLRGHDVPQLAAPEYRTSARRLLHEPEALFTGTSYLGDIHHFRRTSDDRFAWLEHFAGKLEMRPLQRYVVKNYVLQPCITRPRLAREHADYLGPVADQVRRDVEAWHRTADVDATREIFAFADTLADRYGDAVLEHVLHLADAARAAG